MQSISLFFHFLLRTTVEETRPATTGPANQDLQTSDIAVYANPVSQANIAKKVRVLCNVVGNSLIFGWSLCIKKSEKKANN